jgi:integrase/recombinase XerD
MVRAPWTMTREMFLDEAEVRRLLGHLRRRRAEVKGRDAPGAHLDAFLVEALCFSGLRNSEICRLRVADVDLEGEWPSFFVGGRDGSHRGENRTVVIPGRLAAATGEWIRTTRAALLPETIAADDPDQPLIINEHHRPYERSGLYRRVVRILREAGFGDRASVHLLRHTYGYLAYRRTGGNLLFVQRQLGHAHAMITAIYAQFVEESYGDLADATYVETAPVESAGYDASIEDDTADEREPARLL